MDREVEIVEREDINNLILSDEYEQKYPRIITQILQKNEDIFKHLEVVDGDANEIKSSEHEDNLNDNTESYLQDLVEEERLNAIEKAEELQQKKLSLIQSVQELIERRDEKEDLVKSFFRYAKYDIVREGGEELKAGDCSKVVLVYNEVKNAFELIFGSIKAQSIPTDARLLINYFESDAFSNEVGFHREIRIEKNSTRFGGGAYLVMENNTILIDYRSYDFGGMPKSIVKKCLEKAGYKLVTLTDGYFQNEEVFRGSIRNKLIK